MANNAYAIDVLAPPGPSVTVTDDGSGVDWLTVAGTYEKLVSITLSSFFENGVSTQASGTWFVDGPGNRGGRLFVNGLVENVRGSNGADDIIGNEANNLIYGDAYPAGPGGNDVVAAAAGNDTVLGGAGNDTIGGGAGNDRLFGNAGSDTINGDAGIDVIEGGAGADFMAGGASARDTVSYLGSTAAVSVRITHGATTIGAGGDAASDRISGFTDVRGSAQGDTIVDTVKATIAFGYNDNSFFGGAGNDTLALGGGSDRAYGEAGADRLLGELGNDLLDGGADGDLLTGGASADSLFGGAGGDRFAFLATSDSGAAGIDVINDFSRAQGDRIDLSAIDARNDLAGNQGFVFVGAAAFSGVAGELRAATLASDTMIYADINGDRRADFVLRLDDPLSLLGVDFVL